MAISFAFTTRREPEELVAEASALSVKIVEKLAANWTLGSDDAGAAPPDLYTINVPLVEGVASHPVRWTWMLDNKWSAGSLYKAVEKQDSSRDADRSAFDSADAEMQAEREGGSNTRPAENGQQVRTAPSFKWAPSFADVWSTIEKSRPGNDGLAVRDGETSVTPLRANFEGLYGRGGFVGELKL